MSLKKGDMVRVYGHVFGPSDHNVEMFCYGILAIVSKVKFKRNK